ncbi:NAD-dependent epimerase/dehydratase family protein [Pedobacter sp. HMF7647]|uniref:NAD-dependent epimerase/dehydratase family protein n=1 Tax=Hufsiella arboris TaxID=2695275 RepID=A0A7K1YDL7_9SPHI|nr:GDP-mannose 4,6-dehydratase [Hufsiella arboris]MXV52695.1 NAD-dependent epimerase/dehydratase family protein [Hufsiella arboris]
MKRILVTGGAGFIGSNLTAKLLKSGRYHVTSIDNFDPFYSRTQKERNIAPFHQNFQFIQGDIRNSSDLEKVGAIDAIVHLAAKAGVRPSIKDPVLYNDVNVAGTQNLLEFAKRREIKQFVFASSSSVYGVNPNVPWDEEEKLFPISPYASSKLSAEMLGHVYSHLYGIRFLALRFFTVYGPGQRPDLAIHKFFKSIENNLPIPVFGDGSTSRDYTFVDDTVKGIEAAINYQESDFEIINLGNHNTVTLSTLIDEIENTCGKKAIIDRRPEQPGDVPQTFADISKAEKLLGYKPQTDLKTGLKKFYQWYQDNRAYVFT